MQLESELNGDKARDEVTSIVYMRKERIFAWLVLNTRPRNEKPALSLMIICSLYYPKWNEGLMAAGLQAGKQFVLQLTSAACILLGSFSLVNL